MANLTVSSITPVKVYEQVTAPVGEAVTAGQYVRFNTSTGKLELGNGSSSGEAAKGGLALTSAVAGETVTAVISGLVDIGNALSSINFNASVYLSDTDGTLADAAGTSSRVVGRVYPAWGYTSADKLLKVELGG